MKHKIAMVGFGGMAGWHYNLIKDLEDLEVAGIWDIKEERREYAGTLSVKVYSGLEELLADPQVDLVLIAAPNDVHKSVAIAALEAGKNVVSEKAGDTQLQGSAGNDGCSGKNGKFPDRSSEPPVGRGLLTVKKILEEGKLGEVFSD